MRHMIHSENAQVSPQDAKIGVGLRSRQKRLASELTELYFIYKMNVHKKYLGNKFASEFLHVLLR